MRQISDFVQRFWEDVDAAAAGVVVDHHRQGDVFGDVLVEGVDFVLAGMQAGRGEDHDAVGADGGGVFGDFEGDVHVGGHRADDDRNAPGHFLHGEFGEGLAFFKGQRGKFAGRAEGEQAVHAGFDEPVDVLGAGGVVDLAVFLKVGDGDGENAVGLFHEEHLIVLVAADSARRLRDAGGVGRRCPLRKPGAGGRGFRVALVAADSSLTARKMPKRDGFPIV